MPKESDVKGVVSRQNRYSTLAKKEGQYALKKEKEERALNKPEMAKQWAKETPDIKALPQKVGKKKTKSRAGVHIMI